MTKYQCLVSPWVLTFPGMNTLSQWQNLQHVSLTFLSGPNAFSPPLLYKAQIGPCLKYLWRGASNHSLNTLDAIQRRAIRLIGDPALTDTLDSLVHRRSVSALSLFYRYYHGFCSDEIKSIIPPKASFFEIRDFLRSNTPKRLNWIPIERTHSPIRLFL